MYVVEDARVSLQQSLVNGYLKRNEGVNFTLF